MNEKTIKIIFSVSSLIVIGAGLVQALLQGKVDDMEKLELKKEIIDEVLKKSEQVRGV